MSLTQKEKWNEFLEWIGNHSSRVYYRGESNNNYLLRPKVGRHNYNLSDEINMLEHFKRRSNMFVKAKNDFEWLALAQHHGLPTRLLDWTSNPLVACFFATNTNLNNTARIYCLDNCENEYLNYENENSPFDVNRIKILHSPIVTNRIEIQKGLFSIHPLPNKPLLIGSTFFDGSGNKNRLIEVENNYRFNEKAKPCFESEQYDEQIKHYLKDFYKEDKPYFEIEPDCKEYFNKMIRKLGINETIYGDIDSIAKHIEYNKKNNELTKINQVSDKNLISIFENFIDNNIADYFIKNQNILNELCDFKIFENKLYFEFGNYLKTGEIIKVFTGRLLLSTNFNFNKNEEIEFDKIETQKLKSLTNFIKKLNLEFSFNGTYKFDIEIKIQLIFSDNRISISYVKILNNDKRDINEIKKIFTVLEEAFFKLKGQISEQDFNIIFSENPEEEDLEKLLIKYENKLIL